jgi:prevent-host-death family protein
MKSWKLQDAKARFSEVVRQAKAGGPQLVTVHGEEAVVIFDPKRFDLTPKAARRERETLRDFVQASKKYRGLAEGIEFDHSFQMNVEAEPLIFDKDDE